MLPQRNRVRTSTDFTNTVRSGARSGRRNVVLYAAPNQGGPTRVGFIVARNVGNAVTRNLVKRRLREAAAREIAARPQGLDVVVRALPASAGASWHQLAEDFDSGLEACRRKLAKDKRRQGKVTQQ